MFSLKFAVVAAATLVTSVMSAADYYIDPTSVPLSTRRAWCTSETTQCPLICLDTGSNGKPKDNSCDPATLAYGCVCANGISPNLTEYSLTMPYHKCQQYQENCVKACGLANNECSSNCRTQNPCGASQPKGATTSTASGTAASATATSTSSAGNSIQTGFAGQTGSSSGTGSGASMTAPVSLGLALVGLIVAPVFML